MIGIPGIPIMNNFECIIIRYIINNVLIDTLYTISINLLLWSTISISACETVLKIIIIIKDLKTAVVILLALFLMLLLLLP